MAFRPFSALNSLPSSNRQLTQSHNAVTIPSGGLVLLLSLLQVIDEGSVIHEELPPEGRRVASETL